MLYDLTPLVISEFPTAQEMLVVWLVGVIRFRPLDPPSIMMYFVKLVVWLALAMDSSFFACFSAFWDLLVYFLV